jgi:hypothetical protein
MKPNRLAAQLKLSAERRERSEAYNDAWVYVLFELHILQGIRLTVFEPAVMPQRKGTCSPKAPQLPLLPQPSVLINSLLCYSPPELDTLALPAGRSTPAQC